MTVRAIGKVVEAYKRDKEILCKFRPQGAMVYLAGRDLNMPPYSPSMAESRFLST